MDDISTKDIAKGVKVGDTTNDITIGKTIEGAKPRNQEGT